MFLMTIEPEISPQAKKWPVLVVTLMEKQMSPAFQSQSIASCVVCVDLAA